MMKYLMSVPVATYNKITLTRLPMCIHRIHMLNDDTAWGNNLRGLMKYFRIQLTTTYSLPKSEPLQMKLQHCCK